MRALIFTAVFLVFGWLAYASRGAGTFRLGDYVAFGVMFATWLIGMAIGIPVKIAWDAHLRRKAQEDAARDSARILRKRRDRERELYTLGR